MKSYCFIVNCASNSYKAEEFFKSRSNFLKAEFPSCEIIYINKSISISKTATKAAKRFDVIVACGGDGTVNKVASGILNTNAILGIIPFGSGNDFAKSLGLERNFLRNIKLLKKLHCTQVDVIEADNQIFLNTFGIGIDGLTNYHASKLPVKSGSTRYFIAGVIALLTSNPFDLSYKNNEEWVSVKTWMAVIANGKCEGGKYYISPTSINNDGLFEVVLVKNVWRTRIFLEFLKLSMGFSFNEKLITLKKVSQIVLQIPKNTPIHADGEQICASGEITFRVKRKALTAVTFS